MMRKLIWLIFPAHLLIILITMAGLAWYGSIALKDFYLQELDTDLSDRAYMLRPYVDAFVGQKDAASLKKFCTVSGNESATRITIIDPQGKVLADSDEDPDVMENHQNRPEIVEAMSGNKGKSLRFSRTLQTRMLYVAIPLSGVGGKQGPGAIAGVLRVSVPATAINRILQSIRGRMLAGSAGIILLAALVALLVSRHISRPLEIMKANAERLSSGDFSHRMLGLQGKAASLEVATLAASMDKMAAQLDERFRTIINQRNELETVFSCMVESVLAVDSQEHIINLNAAAAQLFGIDKERAKGRLLQEIVRNVPLQRQIAMILDNGSPLEDEIVLPDEDGERFLQTHLVSLRDGSSERDGVLVVMNDVTKLRRLENMRRDFVANVSHELRTPITSIRGYVETLLDERLEDRDNGIKFLEIVLRQSDRLNAIIEDLLSLSRIEQEAESGEIALAEGRLRPVLETAIQTCQIKADQQDVRISLDCPENLWGVMNDTLIEQAVVNLLVNGIKYSERGSMVMVHAGISGRDRDRVLIQVRDTGIGIGKEHLPRLFERFYRSDKARSRNLGGTGLGLAIVKHIVQAHCGTVEVQSREGQGTTFTIGIAGTVREES
ncbi:MAG: ATP-binding protein [Desulfocapsaceae bacterium]|nr:ATP-binding protein [Desulfocapsaceae bacterium]